MSDFDYSSHMEIDPDELMSTLAELLKHGKHVLAYGPPGTGKTSLAHKIAKLLKGSHAYAVQCHEEMSQSELIVQYLPSPEGGVLVMQGAAVKGWVEGSMVVFDEINHIVGSPAMSTFYRICDDPGIASFLLPDGTVITPQKGFSVWATMNGDPRELPEAVLDRFHYTLCMWRPSREMVDSLPTVLQKVPALAYQNPNDPFPTFRDVKNFGNSCEAMSVSPAAVTDETVKVIAKLIWGPRWTEALHVVEVANREEARF